MLIKATLLLCGFFVLEGLSGRPLTVMTYNVGLLRLGHCYDVVPLVKARANYLLAHLPAFLEAQRVDILVLQELWDTKKHGVPLKTKLEEAGYQVVLPPDKKRLGISSGLLLAVRKPWILLGTDFIPFQNNFGFVRSRSLKGTIVSRVRGPGNEEFVVLGTHMLTFDTKNGLPIPEASRRHFREAAELRALMEIWSERRHFPAVMLLGDLNAGPGYVDSNYRVFERSYRLRNVYLATHANRSGITWDKNNPLVVRGASFAEPSSMCDHCLIRDGDLWHWQPLSASIVLNGTVLTSKEFGAVPLSDHYAVLAKVDLAR